MAGNKFRNFRKEENPKEKEEKIERNSKIILTKDYEILSKAKEDAKYRFNEFYKKGSIVNVLDIIKNAGMMYLKIQTKNKNNIFGYIPLKDNEGNYNVKKYEEKKEEKKINKQNFETYGSIKLGDAKISNNENIQKNNEDIQAYKKVDELKFKIIKFLGDEMFEKEKKESSDMNYPSSYHYSLNDENDKTQNEPYHVEDSFSTNESAQNNNTRNKVNPENISKYMNDNILPKEGSIPVENEKSTIKLIVTVWRYRQEIKKIYQKKIELPNLPLEPKYEKGIQVIYRPLDMKWYLKLTTLHNQFYEGEFGHVFIRYYDKKKGIDKIIESTKSEIKINNKKKDINEIQFSDFKIENLTRFAYFNVLQDEELSDEHDYETVKNILINKYEDENGYINKGEYSLLDNCCFQTVIETLILFGKSPDLVQNIFNEKIHQIGVLLEN